MPFAPSIRKQILNILSERIIPLLDSTPLLQLLLEPPYHFEGVPHWTVRDEPLPDIIRNPLDISTYWNEVDLSAWRMSQLAFSYNGVSEEKIGLTQQMAKALQQRQMPLPGGVTALEVKAPAAFYVPPYAPHCGRFLDGQNSQVFGILVLHFTTHDFFLRFHDSVHGVSHSLYINDGRFKEMEGAYVDLLRKRAYDAAQRYLLHMMQALHQYLTQHTVSVSNSAWKKDNYQVLPGTSRRVASLCHQAMDHIQFHLSDALTLEHLAKVCGVTPQYLSLSFSRAIGVPLMSYVTLRRLSAAEMILALTNERITDVAQLTGFSSSHSFAVVFKRHYGMSPRQYRQRFTMR